jgi:hypothetical protein
MVRHARFTLGPLDPPLIAVTFNLTVTLTVGAGWPTLYPGDVAFGGTSSFNWFGNPGRGQRH